MRGQYHVTSPSRPQSANLTRTYADVFNSPPKITEAVDENYSMPEPKKEGVHIHGENKDIDNELSYKYGDDEDTFSSDNGRTEEGNMQGGPDKLHSDIFFHDPVAAIPEEIDIFGSYNPNYWDEANNTIDQERNYDSIHKSHSSTTEDPFFSYFKTDVGEDPPQNPPRPLEMPWARHRNKTDDDSSSQRKHKKGEGGMRDRTMQNNLNDDGYLFNNYYQQDSHDDKAGIIHGGSYQDFNDNTIAERKPISNSANNNNNNHDNSNSNEGAQRGDGGVPPPSDYVNDFPHVKPSKLEDENYHQSPSAGLWGHAVLEPPQWSRYPKIYRGRKRDRHIRKQSTKINKGVS